MKKIKQLTLFFVLFFVIICFFSAFIQASFPVSQRLVAPLVCPEGYLESIVTAEDYNTEGGGVSTSSTLYCVEKDGKTRSASFLNMITYSSLVVTLALFVLLKIYYAIKKEDTPV